MKKMSKCEECGRFGCHSSFHFEGRSMHYDMLLGKGKFSCVYECFDVETKQRFAIKCLKDEYDGCFLTKEYQILKILDHKNVVKTFGMSMSSPRSILLELCKETLDYHLKKKSSLTEEEVKVIFKQIVEGLEHIHSKNIIHRDISLGNMLVSSEDIVKISDFGLAKLENEVEPEKVICGSTDYVSPEMLKEEDVTPKCDIWALGVILFRLLYGYLPFHCQDKEETKQKIKEGNWTFPSEKSISPDAKDLLTKILELDPISRPSAKEILSHKFISLA